MLNLCCDELWFMRDMGYYFRNLLLSISKNNADMKSAQKYSVGSWKVLEFSHSSRVHSCCLLRHRSSGTLRNMSAYSFHYLSRILDLGTCEGSRFDSNSNRTSRFEFESDVPIRKFRIGRTCRVPSYRVARCPVLNRTVRFWGDLSGWKFQLERTGHRYTDIYICIQIQTLNFWLPHGAWK